MTQKLINKNKKILELTIKIQERYDYFVFINFSGHIKSFQYYITPIYDYTKRLVCESFIDIRDENSLDKVIDKLQKILETGEINE